MILNEDYFNDLDIKDEDIIDDVELPVRDTHTNSHDYSRHLTTQFKQCIIIQTTIYNDLFYNKTLWNSTIPSILRRVELILDVYNVDYEITFRDNSKEDITIQPYPVGNYNVYSSYRTAIDFYDRDATAFVIIYCNFPKLTYKESYNFVDRLQNAIWREDEIQDSPFEELNISDEAYPLEKLNADYTYWGNSISLTTFKQFVKKLINPDLPYKTFFKDAIYTFNNTDEDHIKVKDMYNEILNGNNPFNSLKNKDYQRNKR